LTATPTSTFTYTLTPTSTWTSTPSSTFTPSPTPSVTTTWTNTPVYTFTITSTPTFTLSFTPTPTGTPTSAVVSLSSTTGPVNSLSGSSGVTALQVTLTNPANTPVTLVQLTLDDTGTASTSNITLVTVLLNGTVVATSPVLNGSGQLLTLSNAVVAGANATLTVLLDDTASTTGTYQLSIAAGGLTGTSANNGGQAAQFTGLPLQGLTVNCQQPSTTPTVTLSTTSTATLVPTKTITPVPSATSTGTSTVTATGTASPVPTVTPVHTATATSTPPSQVVVSPPYPNPSLGGPVTCRVDTPSPVSIKWKIYTLSFRQVEERDLPPTASAQLVWDLTDKSGTTVSDGLYYWVIEVTQSGSTTRTVRKVLVLR
jgi:hypothetical protein